MSFLGPKKMDAPGVPPPPPNPPVLADADIQEVGRATRAAAAAASGGGMNKTLKTKNPSGDDFAPTAGKQLAGS